MIVGSCILAGIFGTSAYPQASSKGWRMVMAGAVIMALAAAVFFGLADAIPESAGRTALKAQETKLVVLATLGMAGACLFIGALLGPVLRRWHRPGRIGGLVFVASLVGLNLYSLTQLLGSKSWCARRQSSAAGLSAAVGRRGSC